MFFNPKLGMRGNVERALKEGQIRKNEIAREQTERLMVQSDTDALLVDQEYRLTLLELGLTE